MQKRKIYNKAFITNIMDKRGEVRKAVDDLRHKMDVTELLNSNNPIRIPRTFGQRAADALTTWAGSWTFIISLGILLLVWIIVNTSWLLFRNIWDPYPFILLNFILSTLAAIQAPIILMSQNREAQKDRMRAQYDYAVNKKAEKEIQELKKQLSRIERFLSGKKR
jgi:uncharacterized membrane protein